MIGSYVSPFYSVEKRHEFIKKVYAILLSQVSITILFCLAFIHIPSANNFAHTNNGYWLMIASAIFSFVIIIVLTCCFSRSFPTNIILLFVFTIAESYTVAFICAYSQINAVLNAFVGTAIIVMLVTAFAFQTRYDFTTHKWGIGLFVALIAVMVVSILNFCFFHSEILHFIIAIIMVIVFSFYLVYDTQLIIGGEHQNQYSEDDYVVAAISLYLDIINIFVYMLQLMSGGSSDD